MTLVRPWRSCHTLLVVLSALVAGLAGATAHADDSALADTPNKPADQIARHMGALARETTARHPGTLKIDGRSLAYTAEAGTITLHGKGAEEAVPTARMFYVAYFAKHDDNKPRPVTFIYNGGPGSASVWLHMGAFGPKRVVTNDDSHTPAAPYQLVDNASSLLDVSDLVFVDAPGTGYSRLIAETPDADARDKLMKARKKHFFSTDGDADAFAQFITRFLSRHDLWNAPKYLFGESYGTTRSAILANQLASDHSIDLNGVILLSQILNFDLSIDGPGTNPGQDMPYVLALPSYAATAWYHQALPGQRPAKLKPFLAKVEQFATGPYLQALVAGNDLADTRRDAIAEQLHQYTGLSVDYLKKANLRVEGGEFEKNLLGARSESTGRLDTRFAGPSLDPLSQGSQYDPQSSALSSAYVSAFNHYIHSGIGYNAGIPYRPVASLWSDWDFSHTPPSTEHASSGAPNVMPDLARAMKTNPRLQILLAGGYYDLATPFYAARYEMAHLPIPKSLTANIHYRWYHSGHMVYAHPPALAKLHDDVAAFIRQTDNLGQPAVKKTPSEPSRKQAAARDDNASRPNG